MRSHFRVLDILAAVAATLLFSTLIFASLDRGQIQGTVTDPQGGVVPGVAVVVTNVNTGVQVRLKTNSTGFYLAQELVPGKYTVHVGASGFSPEEITGLTVTAGTTTTADAALRVGATTQTVEVKGENPLVETTPSNFTTSLDRTYIENMPLQGRDIQTLVQLIPGVIQSSGPSGATFGFNSQYGGFPDPLHLVGSSISANGGQAGANSWYLEGASNATVGAESVVVNPSPDAVAEFNFVDNGLAAEYGRTSGAVVNVVLKSGTNKLHGDVYEVNRNSYFSATNPFARRDQSGNPFLQPAVNWNDFGGTLGGPVYLPHIYNGKNRTFFFSSWDVSLLHQRQNRILTVPLPAERMGDFTGDPRFAAQCGPAYPGVTNCLYDPLTTTGPGRERRLPPNTLPDADGSGQPIRSAREILCGQLSQSQLSRSSPARLRRVRQSLQQLPWGGWQQYDHAQRLGENRPHAQRPTQIVCGVAFQSQLLHELSFSLRRHGTASDKKPVVSRI